MKRKELLRNYYDRIEEIQRDVDEYVEIFNNMRPHQRLGIQTPSEVEQDFAEKNKRVFWTFQQKVSKIPLQYQSLDFYSTGEFTGRGSETHRHKRKEEILCCLENGALSSNLPQKRKSRPAVRSAENRKNGRDSEI